jgi:tetratricopeptide (TPR) repeat protein
VATTDARNQRVGEKQTPRLNPDQPVAEQILGHAQASRGVIQDFVPLAESLEWELGQQYLRDRGNKAFISDASPVPFVINNDGTLSRNAAEVFYASLEDAEKEGSLEPDIFVLELGIGVGLFARFFLDNFRDLCARNKKDYYDRLCYIAADKSERMLMDVCRHGVLANHPGRYRVRQVDAMEPGKLINDVMFYKHPSKEKPFRAVFLNYLLDCLPASVLEIEKQKFDDQGQPLVAQQAVKQLCVRTLVARNIRLSDYTDMTLEQLQDRAKSDKSLAKRELLEVYGLFASEYDYRPVDYKKLPYGEFGFEYARRWAHKVLLSYGAIQSLERLLDLVNERGFILINDYGQTQATDIDEFEHQRFSLATFVGLNFPLLEAYFRKDKRDQVADNGESTPSTVKSHQGKCQWFEPGEETGGIHSRLVGRSIGSKVHLRFQELFTKSAQEKLQEPVMKARGWLKVGRFEMAADSYRKALQEQPGNWVLLNEVSMFLTFSMRDPKAGMDMAKLALGLNPTCSAELWNTLGDGLYEFGRTAEARSAYQRAMEVNGSDVRARFNLVWVHVREKNFPAALEMLGQALALDKTGEYRDRLLQKFNELLTQLTQRHQQEYLLLINLVSKYARPEDQDKPKPDRAVVDRVFTEEGR